MNEVVKDVINPHHLEKFSGLIRGRIPGKLSSHSLAIGDHLLFFNALNRTIGRDGYFDHQSPKNLLKDPRYEYLRRVWAKGQIELLRPLSLGQEYACRESLKFIKRIRGDHYVCLERLIVGSNGESLLRELRTLAYTNSPPRTRNATETAVRNGASLGTFTFRDLDIIIYGQLSCNPHRIHWDRRYSQAVEGYRDIIVQGPFALQVLLKFAEDAIGSSITKVEYRNYNYIYPDTEVEVNLLPGQGQYRVCMNDARRPEVMFVQAVVSCQ
ncbi:hypothetical protein HG536_0E02990 [Torulaspora globosa]|uniref:MaoC-like domain-containing protein n=1 Tax=Torulaspora globosa TaxID=48254 RepID=A0A7G3ZIQ2_9SACH|nr:uncharacterized protein HG536_0E02990 [Torulaspora globosa]QLL33388.1 hypothetical protein HG536_0E02990 [Torulaspora globosa]